MAGYRIFHRAIFSSVLFSALSAIAQAETGGAGDLAFEKKVKPFLEEYCMDCHDNDSRKGKVSLEDLNAVSPENATMWRRIWEQVALKEMPPR